MNSIILPSPLEKSCGFLGVYLGNNNREVLNLFKTGSYCVYVVLDTWCKITTSLCGWVFPYAIKYIGMGTWYNGWGKSRKRPLNHTNDLYSDNVTMDPNRYVLTYPSTCLDKQSAFDLESILIDAAIKSGYSLSPKGLRNVKTQDMQLWNKIHGHKINGNYLRQIIKGEIYPN